MKIDWRSSVLLAAACIVSVSIMLVHDVPSRSVRAQDRAKRQGSFSASGVQFEYSFRSTAEMYYGWLGGRGDSRDSLRAAGIGWLIADEWGERAAEGYELLNKRINEFAESGWDIVALDSQGLLLRREKKERAVAEEAGAISTLRTLCVVTEQYRRRLERFPASLHALKQEQYVSTDIGNGKVNGYFLIFHGSEKGWDVHAVPMGGPTKRTRSLYCDQTHVIRFSETGTASIQSPPID